MRPTAPRKCFKFDMICFTDYGVIAEKPQGRIVALIHVKFGKAERTWVRLAVRNFTSIGARGLGTRP